MRTPVRRRQRGFSLLEMMVSMAILAIALVALISATSQAIRATNHAKLVTTATLLARARLVELEDELQEKGFTDESFAKETSGDFDDKGFKRFTWTTVIDKVELPATDQVQGLVSKAVEAKQTLSGGAAPPSTSSGSSGSGGPLGAGAGFLSSQFGIVKEVLEQGIRRVRVRVSWNEFGREASVEVYQYLTDPRRVDMAIQIPNLDGLLPPPQDKK